MNKRPILLTVLGCMFIVVGMGLTSAGRSMDVFETAEIYYLLGILSSIVAIVLICVSLVIQVSNKLK